MATDEEVLSKLGRRIAEIRQDNEQTQETVAETLGLSVQYIQLVEAGKQNLTITSLNRFANHLGVEMSELFHQPKSMERPVGRPKKSPT